MVNIIRYKNLKLLRQRPGYIFLLLWVASIFVYLSAKDPKWDNQDYIITGILLLGIIYSLLYELIIRTKNREALQSEKSLNIHGDIQLLEYSGDRNYNIIEEITDEILSQSVEEPLHIYMTNLDREKENNDRRSWNEYLLKHGDKVYQHVLFCIRSLEDCMYILDQVDQIQERIQENANINYELRVIYDSGKTVIPPWSILVFGEQRGYFALQTFENKRLSLQALTKEHASKIRNLWFTLISSSNKIIYSKETGFKNGNIEELKRKASVYKLKRKIGSTDIKPICQKIISSNLFLNPVIACYLHGDIRTPERGYDHDIDIIFLFESEPQEPESMINESVLKEVSDSFEINIKVNGINRISRDPDLPTIDICCDWKSYITNQDPVSVIDIAKKKYEVILGDDYYKKLKSLPVSIDLLKNRIRISINYVERCCDNQDAELIRVASKQVMQSKCLVNGIDYNPESFLQITKNNDEYGKVYSSFHYPSAFIGSDRIEKAVKLLNSMITEIEK